MNKSESYKKSLDEVIDAILYGRIPNVQGTGHYDMSKYIKTLSYDVLHGALKYIDFSIARYEGFTDDPHSFEHKIDHLTDWYQILYDELESQKALDLLMKNLTGKGYKWHTL